MSRMRSSCVVIFGVSTDFDYELEYLLLFIISKMFYKWQFESISVILKKNLLYAENCLV